MLLVEFPRAGRSVVRILENESMQTLVDGVHGI
jgi:hypothetical protein